MHKNSAYFLILIFITSCSSYKKARDTFSATLPPPPPQYSQEVNWAALPTKDNKAKLLPSDSLKLSENDVDVFFIHPTIFIKGKEWNADVNNKKLNKQICKSTIKHQASVFNGAGNVYAPHYRQAHLRSFFTEEADGKEALLLAYQDVKRAFQYYLDNHNNNKPFILAAHSQGSFHARLLLQEFIDTTSLKEKLIAAYLVGMPIKEGEFQKIKPCADAEENMCYVSWNTFRDKHFPKKYEEIYKGSVTVNPITWKQDTTYSLIKDHEGVLMKNFKKVYKNNFAARASNGVLWITKPNIPLSFMYPTKNYHIGDYNLFWFNVRKNAEERTNAFLQK